MGSRSAPPRTGRRETLVKEHLENSAKPTQQHTLAPNPPVPGWAAEQGLAPGSPCRTCGHCGAAPSHLCLFFFQPGRRAPQGVGGGLSGVSHAAHDTGGVDVISRGWTLLVSHSHPVTISRSRQGLRQLSCDPAPLGMSQPRPPRQCSPQWKTVSAGCVPRLPHRPGGDLGRQRGEDTVGKGDCVLEMSPGSAQGTAQFSGEHVVNMAEGWTSSSFAPVAIHRFSSTIL